jgi:hypothetical protein
MENHFYYAWLQIKEWLRHFFLRDHSAVEEKIAIDISDKVNAHVDEKVTAVVRAETAPILAQQREITRLMEATAQAIRETKGVDIDLPGIRRAVTGGTKTPGNSIHY